AYQPAHGGGRWYGMARPTRAGLRAGRAHEPGDRRRAGRGAGRRPRDRAEDHPRLHVPIGDGRRAPRRRGCVPRGRVGLIDRGAPRDPTHQTGRGGFRARGVGWSPAMELHQRTRPTEGPLIDTFGRAADDLRISVTDRCNFRCTYCMPAEGLTWLPRSDLLTFGELTRLLGVFVNLGVRSLKVTGGEPTVRADLPNLIRMFRGVGPDLDISITTNGLLLDRL